MKQRKKAQVPENTGRSKGGNLGGMLGEVVKQSQLSSKAVPRPWRWWVERGKCLVRKWQGNIALFVSNSGTKHFNMPDADGTAAYLTRSGVGVRTLVSLARSCGCEAECRIVYPGLSVISQRRHVQP
jgi:hypothetical protein